MLRRQLPALTERVGGTLDRLREPRARTTPVVSAAQWWDGVQRRHGHGVEFRCTGLADDLVLPAELFDGVAENLIANALRKGAAPPAVRVTFDGLGRTRLEVRDDGAAVPAEVARELLVQPVPSATGLGVGLYHCAQHAARMGYRLTLARNAPGDVAFVLESSDAAAG
jgi:signal transduction histidine kinase